jgi:hypothetical protein
MGKHFWVTRTQYLNEEITTRTIHLCHEDREGDLHEFVKDMLDEAVEELGLDRAEFTYLPWMENISVSRTTTGRKIAFYIEPGYTEEEMIAAGLIDGPDSVVLDAAVWGNMNIDRSLVEQLED